MPKKYTAIPTAYRIMLGVCCAFFIYAFLLDTPGSIIRGLVAVLLSPSVLVTDYVALGGIGAALVNSAVSGLFFLALLMACRQQPDGLTLTGLWLTLGFSFFGKNVLNTLPIVAGVWLHAKVTKTPFRGHIAPAMMYATVSPIVSKLAFGLGGFSLHYVLLACFAGTFIGFIFPIVALATKRMHGGFCLYNSGVAGGLIATFAAGIMRSMKIEVLPEQIWGTSHTAQLAVIAYALSAFLIVFGIVHKGHRHTFSTFRLLMQEDGTGDIDFFAKYETAVYVNMGILCALITTLILALHIPINGPVLGGILTVAGFGGYGKNLKNVTPILIGSVVCSILNHMDLASPNNALAILFSTGLAPIAGRFKWGWGILAGILHVCLAIFIGQLNGGLNLYNNGFAGGFVALMLVPVIFFCQEHAAGRFKRALKKER